MAFDKLSRQAKPLLHKVLSHPFNIELFDGTLHINQFNYFLANDAVYLQHYGKLLRHIASRLKKPEHESAFLQFSEDTVKAELALHNTFVLEKLSAPCQAIADYLAHLDKSVKHPHVCVAIASVLPCFWLYRELGKHTAIVQTNTEHPYKSWIETYACPKFDGATELAIKVLNEVADSRHENTMQQVFLRSTDHEINFWEEAYRFNTFSLRTVRKY